MKLVACFLEALSAFARLSSVPVLSLKGLSSLLAILRFRDVDDKANAFLSPLVGEIRSLNFLNVE